MNNCYFIGNIGDEPQLNQIDTNTLCVTFSLAINKNWVDTNSGEERTKTTWVKVTCWNKNAKYAKGLQKGDTVYIMGELQINEVEYTDGSRKWYTEIRAKICRAIVTQKQMLGDVAGKKDSF